MNRSESVRAFIKENILSVEVWINTRPRGKDINNGPTEASVAAYQSWKGYKTIYKQSAVQVQ